MGPHWQAVGAAVTLEALLVAFMLSNVFGSSQPPPEPVYVPLVIESVSEPVEAPIESPPLLEPPPAQEPELVAKPLPPIVEQQAVVENLPPLSEPTPAPSVMETIAESVDVPVAVPVATQPVAAMVDPAIAYNVELTKAVQAAFKVPGSAAALGFKGRARIGFTLLDGTVSAITLILSSTLGAVDRAALNAVEKAEYPAAPEGLQGMQGIYEIWVECF
jgi:periplasmic protein TonB